MRSWSRRLAVLLVALFLSSQPRSALAGARAASERKAQVWKKEAPARRKAKFERVERFAKKLPQLRARVTARLQEPRLDKDTALAAIVRIMDTTYMRVGSEIYSHRAFDKETHQRPSFGAASLRKQFVTIKGDEITFRFWGKSRQRWEVTVHDQELASTLEVFKARPGSSRLFEITNERGERVPITEEDVRDYLSAYGGLPKDLRTYHAGRLLKEKLDELPAPSTRAEAKANLHLGIKHSAENLVHGEGVDRDRYQDPATLKAYLQSYR